MWANTLLDWRILFFEFVLFTASFAIRIFFGARLNGMMNILLISTVASISIFWTLHLNKNYVHYKKKTLAFIWKEYNFIGMSIAIWIIERENKDEFNGFQKTQLQSDIVAAMNLLAWVVGALFLSLFPGMFMSKRVTNSVLLILMLFLIYQGMEYYFNQDLDTIVTVLNKQVSMRNQVVNRSMDLSLWIGYQAYQCWKHPNYFK